MACLTFFIFLKFFAVIQASKPRSVNVALETVLEFNSKDDVEFIDTMQTFLKKLRTTIVKNKVTDETKSTDDNRRHFVFTDFLTDAIDLLRTYKDEDLKEVVKTLGGELKTWQTRKDFHEITDKLGFRRLIERDLKNLKNYRIGQIRRRLDVLYEKIKSRNRKGFLGDLMNYIYKKESEMHLKSFLNNLRLYRSTSTRNTTDLKEIVRNGIINMIEPILKLNTGAIDNINSMLYRYLGDDDIKNKSNGVKYVTNKEFISKGLQEKHTFKKVVKDNEILDYIEDHIKVINKFTTKDVEIKIKTRPKVIKNTGQSRIQTSKSKKLKTKKEKIKKSPSEKKNKSTEFDKKEDEEKKYKAVRINLESSSESLWKSIEKYLTSTKRHKHGKKSKKHTTNEPVEDWTTKSRKAFSTTQLSVEGLSIEHFGSLFGREFHRKSNDNDALLQPDNSTTSSSSKATVKVNQDDSTEIKKVKKWHKIVEDDTKDTKTPDETNNRAIKEKDNPDDLSAESIKVKGNIEIENPTAIKTRTETKVTKPSQTTFRNYNVSVVPKKIRLKPSKSTIYFRGYNDAITNKTEEPATSISTSSYSTTNTIATTVKKEIPELKTMVTANESKTDDIVLNEDVSLNEIDDETDMYNKTAVSENVLEFQNLMKNIPDDGVDKKVRDAIQKDIADMLTTPSTKSTVTQPFTDPFEDIDDGADIL